MSGIIKETILAFFLGGVTIFYICVLIAVIGYVLEMIFHPERFYNDDDIE